MAAALECWSSRASTDEDMVEQVLLAESQDEIAEAKAKATTSSSHSAPSAAPPPLPPPFASAASRKIVVTDSRRSLSCRLITTNITMSRRPSRCFTDVGNIPFMGSFHPKTHSSPLLSIGLVVVGAFLIIWYLYSGSGGVSCTLEVQKALPILKKAYGDSMRKVLHIGLETCTVVSKLLKEEDTEAWGVQPYELDDADSSCKSLVHKGVVRVADIKFPLPYRSKSFSVVVVSDTLDYLSPRYLNKTLPELARVSSEGFVVFTGYPGQHRAKVTELTKFGRPAKLRSSTWWIRFFVQTSIEENEAATKKYEQAATKILYKPACQVFHLKSRH
ncbi:putative pectin methylesterase CGR3 [Camellia lanceoleosa]|uniref:Pectin methylesterase CGR3 n=1 Tax=Camellia lanceoleosa TaxID=1840588 RepID=A0ACC0IRB9_9ERIC|nr:putative pectin methylesterase CGR3 [Camellia lanceoleosa]